MSRTVSRRRLSGGRGSLAVLAVVSAGSTACSPAAAPATAPATEPGGDAAALEGEMIDRAPIRNHTADGRMLMFELSLSQRRKAGKLLAA